MISPLKIIAARPRPARKPSSRRGVGRTEVVGKRDPAPSARARYTTTTPGTGKPIPAPAQTTEKIIVSNLPTDVNEAQVKVCSRLLGVPRPLCSFVVCTRNCSTPLSDLSRTSPFTTMPPVAQRESPTLCFKEKATQPRPTSSTTTASLMGVSIDHSFIFVLCLCLWRCGALVVFIRFSPRCLEDQTSASRETSRQTLKPVTVFGALQDVPVLRRFSVGELYCPFRPSRRRQFWSSPRLLCGFASTKGLSTEARNWNWCGASQNHYFAGVSAFSLLACNPERTFN